MGPITATLVILGLAIVAFLSGRIPLAVVATGVAVALWATGVLTLDEALAGFGDPTVLFIAALFIVSEALDVTGVTAWAGQQVIARAGKDRAQLLVVVSLLVALLTALISVNGAVAALLPLVVVVAARTGVPTSQLMMPLAFAAHAGSMLMLTGTPVNIIVSEAAADAGERRFGFFEFGIVGVPLLIGTIVIMVFLGKRVLPDRPVETVPTDVLQLAATLRTDYELDEEDLELLGPQRGVSEVLIPPRSPLVGTHVFPGMTTPSGDLVILGARRGHEKLYGADVELLPGDAVLLSGTWADLDRHTSTPEVLVVDEPDRLRRSVPLTGGAKRAVVVLGVMIVLLATGVVPAAVAALLAAGALLMMRVLTIQQAYRGIAWTTVVLVAGMIPLARAFETTGTADLIADTLLRYVGTGGPHLALLLVCLLTLVLGQLISNTATVLVIAPVAIAVATTMGVSVLPFMMALTVIGGAAFLTPIATPANLMVMEPGGYRFNDYWKLGLPLAAFFLFMSVVFVPLVWPF
ncbi:MAG: TRAP transporter large permease subunit [Actinomycetales bacterium]|nr:TRAP transporter large permease subunit [Actinomycetales bacterium]